MFSTNAKAPTFENHANDNFHTPSDAEAGFAARNEVGVHMNHTKLNVMCRFSDGSSCHPFITVAVDENTGEVVYQSAGVSLMTPQELALYLHQVERHLAQSGKTLDKVVVDLSAEFCNEEFISACSELGVSVVYAPLMAVNRAERYSHSLETFLHGYASVDIPELWEVSDYAHTYADQIYNLTKTGSGTSKQTCRHHVVNHLTGELIFVKSRLAAKTANWILADPTTESLCINQKTLRLVSKHGVEELRPDFVSRRKGKTYYIVVMQPDKYTSKGVAAKLDRFAYQVQDMGHDLFVVTG